MNHNERFIATVAECEALARTRGHSLGRWHRLSKLMHASICVVCNEMTWVTHSGDGGRWLRSTAMANERRGLPWQEGIEGWAGMGLVGFAVEVVGFVLASLTVA